VTITPVDPPEPGTEDWGDDLNTYLEYLEARIVDLENRPQYVYNSYAWMYNNGAPPATGSGVNNQVRLNNVDLTQATLIDIRKLDADGADRTPIFQRLVPGSMIRINDWDNAASLHRFDVTAAPTMDATNAQIPVAWESGGGVIPNAKANVAFLIALTL
jgi:hypothetical protein